MTANKKSAIQYRNGYKPYTEEEIKFIKDNMTVLSRAQIAVKLNRTIISVDQKLYKIRKAEKKLNKQSQVLEAKPRTKIVNTILKANSLVINLNTQTLGTIRALTDSLDKRGINYSLVGAA